MVFGFISIEDKLIGSLGIAINNFCVVAEAIKAQTG